MMALLMRLRASPWARRQSGFQIGHTIKCNIERTSMKTDQIKTEPAIEGVPGIVTLLGGQEVEVTKRDGSKEKVSVRQMTLEELAQYGAVQENEAAMLQLLCSKSA